MNYDRPTANIDLHLSRHLRFEATADPLSEDGVILKIIDGHDIDPEIIVKAFLTDDQATDLAAAILKAQVLRDVEAAARE